MIEEIVARIELEGIERYDRRRLPEAIHCLVASWRERGEALLDTAAHLAAAISLLESGGKKAAPSDKMFAQMLCDYKSSLERARAALGTSEEEGA